VFSVLSSDYYPLIHLQTFRNGNWHRYNPNVKESFMGEDVGL